MESEEALAKISPLSNNNNNNNCEPVPQTIPLEDLTDELLQVYTRINRQIFDYLKGLLEARLVKRTKEDSASLIPVDIQLYLALQFLCIGHVAHTGNLSPSSLGDCIDGVVDCLIEAAPDFIKFPTVDEIATVQKRFYSLGKQEHVGFPNVLGVIDCVHVKIQAPASQPNMYVNRHSQHSINVQIVCGPDSEIYSVLAAFPGGCSDSYIWQNSNLRRVLIASDEDIGWLIGDVEYPQEEWLMTPIVDPKSPGEELYNKAHNIIWKCSNRCIGGLQYRFGCLQTTLEHVPERACAITTACCILHNICLQLGFQVDDQNIKPSLQEAPNLCPSATEEGVIARDTLIQSNFSG